MRTAVALSRQLEPSQRWEWENVSKWHRNWKWSILPRAHDIVTSVPDVTQTPGPRHLIKISMISLRTLCRVLILCVSVWLISWRDIINVTTHSYTTLHHITRWINAKVRISVASLDSGFGILFKRWRLILQRCRWSLLYTEEVNDVINM